MPRAERRSGFNTDSHRIGHGLPQDCANPCCVCDNLCFYAQWRRGIQPERLNAEGDSPSALSRGLSVSAAPGTVCLQGKRLKDANVAAKEADFRVFQTHHGRCYDTEGYASLHPRLRATRSARAFDLSGRAAVKLVIVSLSKAVHPD